MFRSYLLILCRMWCGAAKVGLGQLGLVETARAELGQNPGVRVWIVAALSLEPLWSGEQRTLSKEYDCDSTQDPMIIVNEVTEFHVDGAAS